MLHIDNIQRKTIPQFAGILLAILLLTVTSGQSTLAMPGATYTLTVDNITDDPALSACTTASDDCSLRGAISYANTAPGGSTIHIDIPAGPLPTHAYYRTFFTAGENNNQSGDLDVTTNTVELHGAGRDLTIIDAQLHDRVIDHLGGTLTLISLDLRLSRVETGNSGGGGVLNRFGATLNLIDVMIEGNEVYGSDEYSDIGGGVSNLGGVVYIQSSTIYHNHACNGGGIGSNSAYLTVHGGVIYNNEARVETNCGSGGGITTVNGAYKFDIQGVWINGNIAERGGGVFFNGSNGSISRSLFQSNGASGAGAGLINFGTLTLTAMTFWGNETDGGGGGVANMKNLTMNNVTFSGNSAFNGGGLYNYGATPNPIAVCNHCTFVNNTSPGAGQALWATSPSMISLANSIVSSATPGSTCSYGDPAILTDLGHNLSSDQSCSFSVGMDDIIDTDPLLDGLKMNGGATPTCALLNGSPAIDKGDPASTLLWDQRGYPRTDGNGDGSVIPDIGAFEYGSFYLRYFPFLMK